MNEDLQQILAALHAIDVRLARIEERSANLADYEKRLSNLEKWRERLVGLALGVSALSSLLTGLLLWGLSKLFT